MVAGPRPDGVRADEVAETLGKSVSTAYNLLASLCDEGVAERRPGGVYRLRPLPRDRRRARSTATTSRGVVDDLLARTHKRAYLAVLRANGVRVVLERGMQGMPKLPGMSPEIEDNAHALALGKVVLARRRPTRRALHERAASSASPPTPSPTPTVCAPSCAASGATASPSSARSSLDFCCLAAPVLDAARRFLGAVGISMSRRAFDAERDALEETLRDVVRFQPSADRSRSS